MTTIRLPFAPLEQLATRWLTRRHITTSSHGDDRTTSALADLFGVDRTTIHQWRTRGIPFDTADQHTHELGRTIDELWPADLLDFACLWLSLDMSYMRERRRAARKAARKMRQRPPRKMAA